MLRGELDVLDGLGDVVEAPVGLGVEAGGEGLDLVLEAGVVGAGRRAGCE